MSFGDIIRELRVEHGWSQREVERRCGLANRSVTRYEAKGNTPTILYAEIVMAAFGYRLRWEKVTDTPPPVPGDFIMEVTQKYGLPKPHSPKKEMPGQLAIGVEEK